MPAPHILGMAALAAAARISAGPRGAPPMPASIGAELTHVLRLLGDTGRMSDRNPRHWRSALFLLILGAAGMLGAEPIGLSAQREMQELQALKHNGTQNERKLDIALRLALQRLQDKGVASRLPALRVLVPDPVGRLQVDVRLHAGADLAMVRRWLLTQPEVQLDSAVGSELRAWVPWRSLEALAALTQVKAVRRAMPAMSGRMQAPAAASKAGRSPAAINVSQGLRAHRVDVARSTLGMTGLGQKVCALSDSVDHLSLMQVTGDVAAAVDILPGQSGLGLGFSGEGTAMLEIIHDLAPDAELGFATAFTGVTAFAQNVRDLRFVAGCDVMVDDLFYFNESPFQDGPIAQAVNDVIADGALYFSAAGNFGNASNGTSSAYQGDFVDAGALPALPGGTVNLFSVDGIGSSNQMYVLTAGFGAALFWSDALGASGNDYDVFVMSPDLQHVLDAGVDVQDGDDDPFEMTGFIFPDDRVVVWKAAAAAPRYLALYGLSGRFNLGTSGGGRGHAAALGAYSVAAVDAITANNGAFGGGSANPVEPFSVDGPRKMFYASNGALLNTGNPSLLGDGGIERSKPDIAAADGVATATPGFSQFYGTSAAAPHAAAIAALLKQAVPTATPVQVRSALTTTALDIEDAGVDVLSGAGIVMADSALNALGAVAAASIERGAFSLVAVDGDGDALAEPGETLDLAIGLRNAGAAPATQVQLTLTSTTPGLSLLRANAAYPNLAPGAAALGLQTFRLRLAADYPCGAALGLQLQASYLGASPGITAQLLEQIEIPVGLIANATQYPYVGPPLPIPDGDAQGVAAALPVVAPGVRIGHLDVHFDGGVCSSDPFATDVGLQHTFVGDLDVRLRSPAGTSVRLVNRPREGFGDNNGNHLCQIIFDDAASAPLADAASLLAPFSGAFLPAEPLRRFNGEPANGTWQLQLIDPVSPDSGVLRAFHLSLRAAQCDLYTPQLLHSDGFE